MKINYRFIIYFGNKTFYKLRILSVKWDGVYKIDNADLSNDITVKTVRLVRGFQRK